MSGAPHAAVLAVAAVAIALAAAGVSAAVTTINGGLVLFGAVMAVVLLAGSLLLGRPSGTTTAIGLLAVCAALAVASRPDLVPASASVLGVGVYLVGELSFLSLATRLPATPSAAVLVAQLAPRVLLAAASGAVGYVVLIAVDEVPGEAPGVALGAVSLIVVTAALLAGFATRRKRAAS